MTEREHFINDYETSARAIARLTEVHASYAWLAWRRPRRYRTLSDLRADRGDVFDTLLTQVLALLMRQGLVELSSVAQDGTRVRASAGAASFRRTETLTEVMAQARTHLDAITRAAADRLEAALAEVPDVTATKARSRAKDATVRVSTTDPEPGS